MKKFDILLKAGVGFVCMAFLFLTGCSHDEEVLGTGQDLSVVGFEAEPIEGQYIIVMAGSSVARKSKLNYKETRIQMKKEVLSKFSNIDLSEEKLIQTYGYTLNGFAAKLDEAQLKVLQNDKRILRIEQDQIITLGKPSWAGGGGEDAVAEQKTPWGITRVNGGTPASDKTAWVIDSGIDLDHPDLNVDVNRSRSFLGGKDADDPDDANGHGTHVAGTIAAIDNSEGVIGVAAGAQVVAVRVLNRRGSGTVSGVIAGIEYVGQLGVLGDVANMSLGGGASTSLDEAVRAASTNVIFCVAAGNDGKDAMNYSPARAGIDGGNILTVSASDVNDNFASFSNYGNPPVSWCAPGVSIRSTWKNGEYNTISGTSMATPHVAGVMLLGGPDVANQKFVNGDPDGNDDPIIKSK